MRKYNKILTKKFLIKEYTTNKKSSVQIAKIIGCNHSTVSRRLIKYKIKIRDNKGKNNPMFGRRRPDLTIRNIKNPPFKGKKRPNFSGKNHPNFGKKNPEHSKKRSKENHPLWGKYHSEKSKKEMSISHGGTGIPYENNTYPMEFFKIRNKILKRDNYICQLCFEYGNEAHHIDYDKENNDENNLCCLCHKCNIKANKNRDYWYAYFMYITNQEIL